VEKVLEGWAREIPNDVLDRWEFYPENIGGFGLHPAKLIVEVEDE
jgi:hypothetical protein